MKNTTKHPSKTLISVPDMASPPRSLIENMALRLNCLIASCVEPPEYNPNGKPYNPNKYKGTTQDAKN